MLENLEYLHWERRLTLQTDIQTQFTKMIIYYSQWALFNVTEIMLSWCLNLKREEFASSVFHHNITYSENISVVHRYDCQTQYHE